MAKQKRSSGQRADRSTSQEQGAGEDQGFEIGNQAAQAAMAGQTQGPAPLDVVRDAAAPLVERAILALQIEPRDEGDVSRHVEIVQRSHLPEDRRALLVDHLLTDQAAAEGIRAAVERWFDSDSGEVRDQVVGALDAVMAGLQEGSGATEGWSLPDGQRIDLAEDALEGTVSVRAEALVRDLAHQVAPQELGERLEASGRDVGSAVRNFCRDVQLALLWDEEEEEEELGGDYAAEESGV